MRPMTWRNVYGWRCNISNRHLPIMKKFKESFWAEIVLLALVSALAYLPDILSLSYYRDDW